MFGTDLNSAFAPYQNENEMASPFMGEVNTSMDMSNGQRGTSQNIVHKSTPIANLGQQVPTTVTQPQFQYPVVTAENQQVQLNMSPQPVGPLSNGSKQDPRIAILVNELKKQQQLTANMKQQSGYLDKLFSKKKDLLKVIQFTLIIVLAMSLHFIIDYYIKTYIKNNDFTFEKELIIRLLYPVGIVFVIWNMKTFLK